MLKEKQPITSAQLFIMWLSFAFSLSFVASYYTFSSTGHWVDKLTYHPASHYRIIEAIRLHLTDANITLFHAAVVFWQLTTQVIILTTKKSKPIEWLVVLTLFLVSLACLLFIPTSYNI